ANSHVFKRNKPMNVNHKERTKENYYATHLGIFISTSSVNIEVGEAAKLNKNNNAINFFLCNCYGHLRFRCMFKK
ncbi:unnamed protein product, partial [Candidula unifasciata]